ncbi:MAG: hypothetical protein JXX29_20740 [Deltaproteobacteria bacterium]|nr:hypothetical protein [Deltaproteobacteria bacterium]MBN2674121.1 hypothetical protein [Deltaproteobacteria bacterium]
MTRGKPIFDKSAVGVTFLTPDNTGTVHLDVNPETGALILAEAHTIRLRGSGVTSKTLDELGTTATKLISEYLSNYLLNGAQSKERVDAKDEAFRTFLGQTVSGLDQMLIETVSEGSEHVVAYRMGTSKHKLQQPTQNSLLNKITNSLEAIVYYGGGAHLSHRGESQMYLVSKQVRKLTQDHIAGGLFSKIGDVADFIPPIHTDTIQMARRDRLIVFSREAAVSSFPLNHLRHWLGEGDPTEQAQRVAEELKKLGKSTGCVMVFAPYWKGTASDDIAKSGVFSLNNLANLETETNDLIPSMPSTPPRESSISSTFPGIQTEKSQSRATRKRKTTQKRASAMAKTKSSIEETSAYANVPKTTLIPDKPTPRTTTGTPAAATQGTTKQKKSPSAVERQRETKRTPSPQIAETEIRAITLKVLEQLEPHLLELETKLQKKLEKRFFKLKGDVSALVSSESATLLKKFTSDKLPGIENRMQHNLVSELSHLEDRLKLLMDESLSGIQNDTVSELSQGTLNAKQLLRNHPDAPQNMPEETLDDVELHPIEDDEIDTERLQPPMLTSQKPTMPPPPPNSIAAKPAYFDIHRDEEDTHAIQRQPISHYLTAIQARWHTLQIKWKAVIVTACTLAGAGIIILSNLSFTGRNSDSQNEHTASTISSPHSAARKPPMLLNKKSNTTLAHEAPTHMNNSSPTAQTFLDTSSAPADRQEAPSVQRKVRHSEKQPNLSSMSSTDLYNRGMTLYLMGDLGKTADKKRLSKEERQQALEDALPYFEQLIRLPAIQPNAWYLKGRTEYNLTKTETDAARRTALAKSALTSYQTYLETEPGASKGKKKTIARNQKRLRKLARP